MERITGPHKGYYIASHAADTGASGERYLGYAKICRRRPDSYWDANCLVKICGDRVHTDAAAAIAEAEACALEQLRSLAQRAEPVLA